MDMRIPKRHIVLETITPGANASFVYRVFRQPCFPFQWHHHPELELTTIVRGRGLRFVGDSVQDYAEGDVCLLGAHTPHTWHSRPAKGQTVVSIVIQFLPTFLGEAFINVPESRRVVELFERSRRGLVLTGGLRRSIAEQMLAMKKQPPGSFTHVCALLSMLDEISRDGKDARPLAVSDFEPTLSKQASRTINAVCGMMNARLDEIPTQAQAAETAGLSPQAFSRFFKRCVGRTYVEYVNHLRIGAACRELMETDRSVTQIAFDAGFNNLSNFNRRFRDVKSMTPRDFRRLAISSREQPTQRHKDTKALRS